VEYQPCETKREGRHLSVLQPLLSICAAQLAERKFGLPLPKEWKEKAKVQRFLQSKGFLSEDIQSIFRNIDG